MAIKHASQGSLEDDGAAVSSSTGVAAETSTGDAVMAETSRTTAARQRPPHGVVRRWRQSPARRSPSTRARRQPPSALALFLTKKRRNVRQEAEAARRRRVGNASGLSTLGLENPSVPPHNLTLAELREITGDFSDDQLLGEGGFGKVYKGVLQNGDMIAVKKLRWTMTGIQDKQYENEARHLMRLKHPNIVQLVGYCSETEHVRVKHDGRYVYAEKSERLLCLEYLPNGNLRNHISDESCGLGWDTRYKIITGICYGLQYLHGGCQASTPIIHRDLKPANILLDDNMVPKIADFGLSRLFGAEQTRTTTKNLDGTLGYMAPEYFNRGIISKELDIFSLGVIIIEIVTGHRKYPDDTSQELIFTVLEKWRNRLEKAPGCTSPEIDCQQIERCIVIGLACMKSERQVRPTITEIIRGLHGEDASVDIDVQMVFGSEVTDSNNYVGSMTFVHCPTTSSALAMDQQVALTIHPGEYQMSQAALAMHQEDYQMLYTDGPPLGHWYPDEQEQMAWQYVSPFPLSMQADPPGLLTQNSISVDEFVENLPNDSLQFCAPIASELPSHRRWRKLSTLVKCTAMFKASKRARHFFLDKESKTCG